STPNPCTACVPTACQASITTWIALLCVKYAPTNPWISSVAPCSVTMSTRCCASSNRHRHQEPTTTSYPRPSHSSSRCATGCRGLSEKLATHLHATTSSTFWTNLTTPCRQTSPLSFSAKKQAEFIQDHCRRAPHHFALHFTVGRHQGDASALHDLECGTLVSL